MRSGWKIVLCSAFAFATAPVAAQNLITNGSFETPIVPAGSFTDFPSGSTLITGWTVFGPAGGVSIVSGSFSQSGVTTPAQSGAQLLDLTGNGTNSTEGVQQTVATIPGHQYQLTYFIGNNSSGSFFGITSTVNVLINGVQVFSDTNSAVNLTSLTWQQFTHTFVASTASTTIGFQNADPPADSANGLDNVVLTDLTPAAAVPTLTDGPLLLLAILVASLGFRFLRSKRRPSKVDRRAGADARLH